MKNLLEGAKLREAIVGMEERDSGHKCSGGGGGGWREWMYLKNTEHSIGEVCKGSPLKIICLTRYPTMKFCH